MQRSITKSLLLVLISCLFLVKPVLASKGSNMFWGIIWTVGTVSFGSIAISKWSASSKWDDDHRNPRTGEVEGKNPYSGAATIWTLVTITSGGIAVHNFDKALETDDNALMNFDRSFRSAKWRNPNATVDLIKGRYNVKLIKIIL